MKRISEDLSAIIDIAEKSDPVIRAAVHLQRTGSVRVKSLAGSARSLLIRGLWGNAHAPFVVVVAGEREAEDMAHDLTILTGDDRVVHILRADRRKHTLSDPGQLQQDDVDAILALGTQQRAIVVVPTQRLLSQLPTPSLIHQYQRTLQRNDVIGFSAIATELLENGFERTDYVGKPGQIAVRGGILDVYPGGWNNPLRIEFWGDAVDSIREFEPLSQRSIREHESVTFLAKVFHDDDVESSSSLLHLIPSDAIVVLDNPEAIASTAHAANVPIDEHRFQQWKVVMMNGLGEAEVSTSADQQPMFSGSIEQLLRSAGALHHRSIQVHIGADGRNNAQRLRDLCDTIADELEDDDTEKSTLLRTATEHIQWHQSALSTGFIWDDIGLAFYAEHQVFGRQRSQRRSRRSESGITQRELTQLHIGDYVVHEDKGVGQFQGIHTIEIGGSKVDCIKVLYSGGDALYVHLNYVHKLSKYAAEEGTIPKLSKLGTAEWERRKERAKRRIKDIARELITLYAERKSLPGFAFPSDTVWQKEFEAAFQYEDTPDQARTTAEVKSDMELPAPMDRLVCGDVGFGKTEIAIRAAFKAAQAGKQVAVLVPTTILAHQHFVTFSDRLHRYPVRIEVLSRFRTRSEQKQILDDLKNGRVDVVIGTHRLLSKDVHFRQLGLLIIDEEHRFGVSAKERLRKLRTTVDTLTLTATPIPRTLNFSLMGARDLSVIETPPRNRLPVITEILPWDDDVIREALSLELERGGQCFVVTDRISDIEKLTHRIGMLAPTMKIGVAHGQMDSEQLENAMEAFLERKTDILIATKIIESGLDIPNANTMIIHNADNFGLAELYQLRGRVGRSNTQAYCYLVTPPIHTLSRVAIQRLQALEEFTDLGSGFKLAMRDLEIRGAGNLLGGEQSGFIMDMGFELYHKILDQAVEELRESEFAELFSSTKKDLLFQNEDVAVELDTDALLPASWIPQDTDRYDAYKRLYNAQSEADIDSVFSDLRDRFGAIPTEAAQLMFAVQLRIAAIPTGFVRVRLQGQTLIVEFPPDSNSAYYEQAFPAVLGTLTSMPNARFHQNGKRLIGEIQLPRREHALNVLRDLQPQTDNKTSHSERSEVHE